MSAYIYINKKALTTKNLIITGKNSLAYMGSIYNFSHLDIIVEFKVF
jgi:hypothetical protein